MWILSIIREDNKPNNHDPNNNPPDPLPKNSCIPRPTQRGRREIGLIFVGVCARDITYGPKRPKHKTFDLIG